MQGKGSDHRCTCYFFIASFPSTLFPTKTAQFSGEYQIGNPACRHPSSICRSIWKMGDWNRQIISPMQQGSSQSFLNGFTCCWEWTCSFQLLIYFLFSLAGISNETKCMMRGLLFMQLFSNFKLKLHDTSSKKEQVFPCSVVAATILSLFYSDIQMLFRPSNKIFNSLLPPSQSSCFTGYFACSMKEQQ